MYIDDLQGFYCPDLIGEIYSDLLDFIEEDYEFIQSRECSIIDISKDSIKERNKNGIIQE